VSTSIRYTDDYTVQRKSHVYGLMSRVTSASPAKARLSVGLTSLFSFVVSGAATLLVCALTPVPPVSLLPRQSNLQSSGPQDHFPTPGKTPKAVEC
jgi:hypothetical protein